MKSKLILSACLLSSLFVGAQEDSRYQEKGYRYTPQAFINYTTEHLLQDSSDVQFISDRNLTPQLRYTTCTDTSIVISDTLNSGEKIQLTIITKPFDKSAHTIKWRHGNIQSIDSLYPYGGEYIYPDFEISSMNILIDDVNLIIPKRAFSNLYDINFCNTNGMFRKIEAYLSNDGKYIYVYFFGGNAASTYHAKLIFDKTRYLTSIIADYYSLSIHGSFRDNFVGF